MEPINVLLTLILRYCASTWQVCEVYTHACRFITAWSADGVEEKVMTGTSQIQPQRRIFLHRARRTRSARSSQVRSTFVHIVLLYTQRSKETDSSLVFLSTIYLQKLCFAIHFHCHSTN